MAERVFAVRGATQVERDERMLIVDAVIEMYDTVCSANNLHESQIISLQFSVTPDLHAVNPATALRSRDSTYSVPLFCMQEPVVNGMLPRTIRLLVHYHQEESHTPQAVYLRGAQALRPDLSR
jgi:chorismate mutase